MSGPQSQPQAQGWPFMPGEAPFHMKGSGYVLHLQYVEEKIPGGVKRFVDALPTPALRAFFAQSFYVGLWYDLMPLIEAGHTCAALTGTSFEQFVRTRSRHQFDGDLHFFRKLVLRLASPGMLAAKIPAVVGSYLDFAECGASSQRGNCVTGSLQGVPRPAAEWIQFVFEEFVHRALEVNGATGIGMRWKAKRRTPRSGVACDDWEYVIDWR